VKEKREREREENASEKEEDHRSLTVEPRRGRRGRHFTALLKHPRIQRQREVRLEIGISREGSSGKRGGSVRLPIRWVGPGRLDVIDFDDQRELSMGTDESGGGVLPVRATSNAVYRIRSLITR
jgi:hypothetical protein